MRLTFLWLLGVTLSANAALLKYSGTPEASVTASGVKVAVYREATLPPAAKLYLTGTGLREKKVALFTANVYIASSYVDDAKVAALPPSTPLEEQLKLIIGAKKKVMQLNFVRDVGADKIREAFRESLKDNGVATENGTLAGKVLAQIQTEMKKGETMTLVGDGDGKEQSLKIELPGKIIEVRGERIADTFWKIWFGKSEESALKRLQMQLLSRDPFPT